MRQAVRQFGAILLASMAVCLIDSETARAEFLLPDQLAETEDVIQPMTTTGSPVKPEQPVEGWQLTDAHFAGLVAGGSSGMSSSPELPNSTSAGQTAIVSQDEGASAALVTYLREETTLLVPTPFLDGVFRPPAC